ncbi:MAG: hypothetical protein ACHQAX_08185 [Gammaproteobacteria bacterium]
MRHSLLLEDLANLSVIDLVPTAPTNPVQWYESKSPLRPFSFAHPERDVYKFREVSKQEQGLSFIALAGGAVAYAFLMIDMLKNDPSMPLGATLTVLTVVGALIGDTAQPALRGLRYDNTLGRAATGALAALLIAVTARGLMDQAAGTGFAGAAAIFASMFFVVQTIIGMREGDSNENTKVASRRPRV